MEKKFRTKTLELQLSLFPDNNPATPSLQQVLRAFGEILNLPRLHSKWLSKGVELPSALLNLLRIGKNFPAFDLLTEVLRVLSLWLRLFTNVGNLENVGSTGSRRQFEDLTNPISTEFMDKYALPLLAGGISGDLNLMKSSSNPPK